MASVNTTVSFQAFNDYDRRMIYFFAHPPEGLGLVRLARLRIQSENIFAR